MQKITIILISILISYFPARSISSELESEYKMAIDEVNQALHADQMLGCPGLDLVVTCGNQICESYYDESEQNCPADCRRNVSVRSYNNITLCDEYTQTQVPHNSLEVQDIVRMAKFKGQKVKAIGASHSATAIMCSEGVLIPMQHLDQVLGIEETNGVLTVAAQAGITVFALSEWLHARGFALAGIPHMGFRDVTIAGAVATGSHGSSPKHAGVISNIVESIELVDGLGQLRSYEKNKTDDVTFKALTANLGLLGIVTQVSLRIQKQFNLDVQVSYHDDAKLIDQGLIKQVENCDYGQLNWFPSVEKYMLTCGVKTALPSDTAANNELLSPKIPKFIVNPFKKVLQYGACANSVMGLIERVRYLQFKLQPPLVKMHENGKIKNADRVVGPAHRMVSSHLISEQEGFFQMDWEIAVPASRAQDALNAIKQHMLKNKTKLPLVGVFVRFAPAESASLMAHTNSHGSEWSKGGTAVFFEMPVYVPVGFSHEKFNQYEKQYVEFARMLITQFSGRPHWGKNREWTLKMAIDHGAYSETLQQFKQVRDHFDPDRIFINKFAQTIGL